MFLKSPPRHMKTCKLLLKQCSWMRMNNVLNNIEKKAYSSEIKGIDPEHLYCGGHGTEISKRPSVIQYPARYIQGYGVLKDIGRYLQILPSKRPVILISKGQRKALGKDLENSMNANLTKPIWLEFDGEASFEEINKHISYLKESSDIDINTVDSIVSVGGGKTIDTGKVIAFELHKKFVSFPTLASNDGPCSALSIIYHANGGYRCGVAIRSNPDCVIVDESIICNAPYKYFVAGIGDAMATYYEAKTCYDNPNGVNMLSTNVTESALCLAKLCCDTLYKYGESALESVKKKEHTKEVSKVIEANINLSGVGFESGGLALAHALAQGLSAATYIDKNGVLHGEMVAIGVIVHLYVEKNFNEMIKCAKFFKSVGLPLCINDIGFNKKNVNDFDKQLENVLDTTMSPQQAFRDNMSIKITRDMVKNVLFECNKVGNMIDSMDDVEKNMDGLHNECQITFLNI